MRRRSTLGHKLMCGLLAGVMAFAVPVTASADEGDVPEWAIDDGGDEDEGLQAHTDFPTAYDLRNEGVVTPVKKQSPWGSCWSFGAIAAAETSLLSSTGSTYANEPLDLSERHLANFALAPITEADDPTQVGEGLNLTNHKNGPNTAINSGGDPFHAATLFASGGGPAPEILFPYRGSSATTDSQYYIEHKQEVIDGEIKEHFDFIMGKPLDQYLNDNPGTTEDQALEEAFNKQLEATRYKDQYVGTDDWSIPATNENGVSNRFGTVGYVLQNGNILPEYWNVSGEDQTLNPAGPAAIKQEILNGRGVAICMKADQSLPDKEGNRTYINQNTWSQYCWVRDMSHAVCIVGWDDNYNKGNFTHTVYKRDADGQVITDGEGKPIVDEELSAKTTPENDGAWLAKNSWGSETDARPDDLGNVVNRGTWGEKNSDGKHTGYFWISYEDKSLTKAETYEFSLDLNWLNDYDCLQYDYMPAQLGFDRVDQGDPSVVSTANVFNIEGDREVKAVSAYAPLENTRITFALYQLNDGATNPTDGQLLYRTSKNFEYCGYHRLDIDIPIILRSGQRLAVVTTASHVGEGGKRLYDAGYAIGVSKEYIDELNVGKSEKEMLPFYSVGVVNEGESFLYKNGAWVDWTGEKAAAEAADYRAEIDNFGIKAYTVAAEVQDVSVAYRSHVQSNGWEQQWYHDGDQSGTTGQAKRLEAVEMKLEGAPFDGSIEYRSHVQGIGWEQSWAADGATSGSTDQSKRIEALQVRLTGDMADRYSVWYRVHSQTFGWLGWAKDGQAAGTAGQSKRVEAVEVQVLPKDQTPADYEEGKASYVGAASGDAHVQGAGWIKPQAPLEFGTTGQSRRLEAVRLSVPNPPVAGGISYEVHAQGIGWMPAAADGALAGTEGESRRLEAVRIFLTGDLAKDGSYSVWYRVHSQTHGWLGWAHDGAEAGTTGLSKRAEAIEVQVLPQGQHPDGYDASQAACVVG